MIPDVCDAWKVLLASLDLDPNARVLRETQLTQLIKLLKEARKTAAERRETIQSARSNALSSAASASSTATSYYHQQQQQQHYGEDQRMGEQYRAAVLLVIHGAEVLSYLSARSDACRAVLKQLKWAWMATGADQLAFESFLGGNEMCGVRELGRGRLVRDALRSAVALGQLPRPGGLPAITLAYSVEDAGTPEVNGLYRFDGFFAPQASATVDTVTPKFARVDPVTGKRFTLFRCASTGESLQWYISEVSDKPGTSSDVDYYSLKDVTNSGLPEGRWGVCGVGAKPPPKQLIPIRGPPNPVDDLLEYHAE